MRKWIYIAIVMIVIIVVAGIALYLFTPQEEEEERPLILGFTASVDSLEPHYGFSVVTKIVRGQVFDRLLTWKLPEGIEVQPGLAESWEASEDLMSYTFHLRDDVYFHDGTKLTSADVKYSIEYGAGWYGNTPASGSFLWDHLESVETPDDLTVILHLALPDCTVPKWMALGYGGCSIAPRGLLTKEGWGTTLVIGSGPYKFVEWVKGDRVVLERNEEYWGAKPAVKTIVIKIIGDPTTARMLLETGEIDIFYRYINPVDIPALIANPELEEQHSPTDYQRFLMFNQLFEPFVDKRVRQAIAYAIDEQRLLEDGYHGEGLVAYSPINSYMTPYSKDVLKRYQYNKTRALELLAEAGYPDGFSLRLLWTPEHYEVGEKDAVLVLADMLEDVGLDVNIEMEEWAIFIQRWKAKDYDLVMHGWVPDFPDPHNSLTHTIHWISPYMNYSNPELFELLDEAGGVLDPEQREALYDAAQEIWAEDLPVYTYKENLRHIFYRPDVVKNFVFNDNENADSQSLNQIWLDTGT